MTLSYAVETETLQLKSYQTNMSFSKHILLLINFLVYINISNGKEFTSSAVTMVEEIGFGAKGITHYLKKLLEGCEDVGDLNNWIIFMESYLSCEDTAWPYQCYEKKLLKTDLELLEHFCEAWPKRVKCSLQLARRLDFCYGNSDESGRKGSNALRFSESYARFICQNKMEYIDNLEFSMKPVPADRKSLNCFQPIHKEITECVKLKGMLLSSNNICSNLDIVQACIQTKYEKSCDNQQTIDWMKKLMKQIKGDFHCRDLE